MQLRNARLCLDCEELHADAQCPVCASESFTYLTRWVPADERRHRNRPVHPKPLPPPAAPRSRWVAGGMMGLTAFAVGRWLWQTTRPVEWQEPRSPRNSSGDGPDEA